MLLKLGDIEIWRILDTIDPLMPPERFFPDLDAAGRTFLKQVAPDQIDPTSGFFTIPVQGFLIKDGPINALVDTCIGNDKSNDSFDFWNGRSDDRFMAGLAAAGTEPDQVTHVLCTHLHVDHVGWNTRLIDGRWVPTFANARYLITAEDAQTFDRSDNAVFTESVAPVIAAGQAELVGPDHGIGDHIRLIPTPGHTPGHVSVEIRAGGHRAVITGDALHSPAQVWHPEWRVWPDMDAEAAETSRRALLAHSADTGALVLGSHFPLPSLGHVLGNASGFEWRAGHPEAE